MEKAEGDANADSKAVASGARLVVSYIGERLLLEVICPYNSKNHKRSKVHRRLGSSTPGSPGSTTAGPNHTQKKSLILAQKER